jgi:hypothetical protein
MHTLEARRASMKMLKDASGRSRRPGRCVRVLSAYATKTACSLVLALRIRRRLRLQGLAPGRRIGRPQRLGLTSKAFAQQTVPGL